ncbi:uncharacterized protein E5676_scaffold282G00050 [Cucumis melo var. makuwa]|uniref:Uncharacterized protein n=1 Tax=Cucumis melo var. makuwa TaxID=1194695 RepID=A0A5D3B9A2_CUCMM|nr:uncharacterized protein E5676_scaffold282G00050 [Cucumis melo var. makuwa]
MDRIPMKFSTEASLAVVDSAIVDFIVPVTYEWKPCKCNSCYAFRHSIGKFLRIVESKVQQEEVVNELVTSKGVVYPLNSQRKREVSVRGHGKSREVTMPNSFTNLTAWVRVTIEPWLLWMDPYRSYWWMGCFDFTLRVMDGQFVSGSLTDLNSGVSVKVLYVYASNINVERHLLWCRLFKITSGDMEEFDLITHEADLVESLIQSNWFTWTSKVQESGLLRHLDHFIDVVSSVWVRREGVSLLVNFMWNLHDLQVALRRSFRRLLDWGKSLFVGSPKLDDGFLLTYYDGVAQVMSCYLPHGINVIAITLISNRCGAEHIEDFQPIFLLSIIDNTLLCQELIEGYHINLGLSRVFNFISIVTRKSSMFVVGIDSEATTLLIDSMNFVLGH